VALTFFCPSCWHELKRNVTVCPYCGEPPASWIKKAYADKLRQALSHPKPQTQRRAVYFLGEKQVKEAIDDLEALLHRTRDPILAGEVVRALRKIGSKPTFHALTEALSHPSFVVRTESVEALASFPTEKIVPLLLQRALQDPSPSVRAAARRVLESRKTMQPLREESDGTG